jgi:hypothetical protein
MDSNTRQSVSEKNPHVVYRGPITPENIDQFPKDLQSYANQLSQNNYPYKTVINSNGNVHINSSASFAGIEKKF